MLIKLASHVLISDALKHYLYEYVCICMKIIELDSNRISKQPDETSVILSTSLHHEEHVINRVELRLYVEHTDVKHGQHYLITSFVDTDIGSVEMIYDEGFLGQDPLVRATNFLTSTLGISSLILRSLISLHDRANNV